jgi:hypothetical protein
MAALMMSGMCASVQAELDGLFGQLGNSGTRSRAVSTQAFSKARRGLSAELFELAPAPHRFDALERPEAGRRRWQSPARGHASRP